jgi:transposase InsO family protein
MSLFSEHQKSRIPILGKATYTQWAFRCREYLESRNVWYIIDAKEATSKQLQRLSLYKAPAPTEAAALAQYDDARDKIIEDSAVARAFIGEFVDDTNSQHIQDIRDPKERWLKLAQVHQGQESGSKLLHLQSLLSPQDFGSIEEHLAHIQETSRNLSAICQPTKESQATPHIPVSELAAVSLLWNLGPDFEVFVTSVMNSLGSSPLQLDDIVPKLLQEHLRLNATKNLETAKAAKTVQSGRPKCQHCGKLGHTSERCFKLHPELAPPEWKHSAKVVTNTTTPPIYPDDFNLSEQAHSCRLSTVSSSPRFLVDSGCTAHMSNSMATMQNIKERKSIISTANGRMDSSHIGDLPIGPLLLHDTLYCPSLTENLISVSKLTDGGLSISFDSVGWRATDPTGVVQLEGGRQGNLYVINESTAIKAKSAVNEDNPAMSHVLSWHERLGHLSLSSMKLLPDLSISPSIKQLFCPHCEIGKASKSPFPQGVGTRAGRVGELIHTDVCGPLPATNSGYRYFVTFIDDYSRMTFVYLMQNKSQVLLNIKHLIPRIENVTGRPVSRIRSDNGGEFRNRGINLFCSERGIKQEFTIPYSPEQNGVAERMNRTLMEMVRCMLSQSLLPKSYWGEALLYATTIRNSSMTTNIDKCPPSQTWSGRPCTYSHFHIFGQKVFAHIPNAKRTKLDPKAFEGVFLGLSLDQKGYRVLDVASGKVTNTRSCKFFPQRAPHTVPKLDNNFVCPPDFPLVPDESPTLGPVQEVDSIPELDCSTEESDTSSHFEDANADFDSSPEDPSDNNDVETLQSPHEKPPDGKGYTYQPIEEGPRDLSNIDTSNILPDDATRRAARKAARHNAFIVRIASTDPATLAEARRRPDWPHWEIAIQQELQALKENNTYSECDLPPGKRAIGSKFVFKTKRHSDGSLERYKARLCAKGFSQISGLDFFETTAPVAKFTSVKILLSIAAVHDLEVHQMDVTTAFLIPELAEDVHMKPPTGFHSSSKADHVWKLNKTIYGLKQSSRYWHQEVKTNLLTIGFVACKSDPCIFVKRQGGLIIIVALYVDDILIVTNCKKELGSTKMALMARWDMKDLGEVQKFIGLTIQRDRSKRVIHISQSQIAHEILEDAGMTDCNATKAPLETKVKLYDDSATRTEADKEAMQYIDYRHTVGQLLFMSLHSRPDLSAAVAIASRFVHNPGMTHWSAVKRIIRYIKGTIDHGIVLGGDTQLKLEGFSDADWANDIDSRRSRTGYSFFLGDGCVSWQSKRQATVALSTTEAEYMSLSSACQELLWILSLTDEIGYPLPRPVTMHQDNKGCIELTKNNKNHPNTKHIDIRHHFIKDLVEKGTVTMQFRPTKTMTADIFTKALAAPRFQELRDSLNVHSRSAVKLNHVKSGPALPTEVLSSAAAISRSIGPQVTAAVGLT